ncbi:hypothetical protein [Phenylobacterium sp.]|uniref:hypothetical protein n=1 Tax=Phenylobacterium sp. TaxID=1871053 RepID=UPI002CE5FFD2|nr:hypothetical protein [Phenylobacterium sp.]HVI32105.1 hypothetical protein [Phenylobacterium sp.]
MRFIVCAVAAAGLLSACASNNDEMAADTGTAAPVADTAPAAAEPAPAPMPEPAPAPAPAPAPSTGERG